MIELLKISLACVPLDVRAIYLQQYISKYGPIPDEHREDIVKLLSTEKEKVLNESQS